MDPNTIIYYLTVIPTIVMAITVHEFAHARVALAFGDPTAHEEGRVSLNPLVHLDPIGLLGMLFAGFGWGRPVPVNPNLLRHPNADLLVSAAGPGANLLLAAVSALPLRIPLVMGWLTSMGLGVGAGLLLVTSIRINLALAFFNFIPLFPLDGSHVVHHLLPQRHGLRFAVFNRTYGYLILLGLILSEYLLPFSVVSLLLGPPIEFFSDLLVGSNPSTY